MSEGEVTHDRLLGGRVQLLQPRRGHRAGTDAVLLAASAPVRDGDLVVDLGAATGAVGLMLAARSAGLRIVMVERDPELIELCRRNIALNAFETRASAVQADVFSRPPVLAGAGLRLGAADLVLTNPPFFGEGTGRPSPERGRRNAHHMNGGDLSNWLQTASVLLKDRGRLAVIHRADALTECLSALSDHFGSVAIRPVHPREGERATRVVLTAVKGGRAPLAIEPPLVLHGQDGGFTPEAARLHGLPAP